MKGIIYLFMFIYECWGEESSRTVTFPRSGSGLVGLWNKIFKRIFSIASHSRLSTALKASKRMRWFMYCRSREDSETNGKFWQMFLIFRKDKNSGDRGWTVHVTLSSSKQSLDYELSSLWLKTIKNMFKSLYSIFNINKQYLTRPQ